MDENSPTFPQNRIATLSTPAHTAVRNDYQPGASKNTPEGPKTNPAANVIFLEINSSTVVDRFLAPFLGFGSAIGASDDRRISKGISAENDFAAERVTAARLFLS